jgi:DNA (cytosine-5)-methyltransferase 1
MRCGHLFNGVGGFALSASWMGWENVFHCEIDEFCNKVMAKNFPDSIQHGDIKTTDFTIYRGRIDLITGGDPCQPSSRAGKKKGKKDERYLWPEYRRCIEEIRPAFIVNENVVGTIENGILDEKVNDLEALGYSWWPPLIIPASAMGANHQRERVWLVAYSNSNGIQRCWDGENIEKNRQGWSSGPEDLFNQKQFTRGFESESESELIRADDGVPDWLYRVKACGNAISPPISYELFKMIEQYDRSKSLR